MTPNELTHELHQFTGTEHWYQHNLNPRITYTDGVKYFAEKVGAYWLLDIITTQPEILDTMKRGGFAVIDLDVNADSTATLTCTDGDDGVTYFRAIEYTDCPSGTWRFFFTDNVILLPSEY